MFLLVSFMLMDNMLKFLSVQCIFCHSISSCDSESVSFLCILFVYMCLSLYIMYLGLYM